MSATNDIVNGDPENTPNTTTSEKLPDSEDKKLLATNDTRTEDPLSVFSNEAYLCDRQYAIVLAQLISFKDREKVYKWIERLDTLKDCDNREDRDLYLKLLTLSLSNGKLVSPFNKVPPLGLRPLSSVMPRSVHNLIYKKKYETGDCGPPPTEKTNLKIRYTLPDEIEPKMFFSHQPVPRNGGIVYAAAFSLK